MEIRDTGSVLVLEQQRKLSRSDIEKKVSKWMDENPEEVEETPIHKTIEAVFHRQYDKKDVLAFEIILRLKEERREAAQKMNKDRLSESSEVKTNAGSKRCGEILIQPEMSAEFTIEEDEGYVIYHQYPETGTKLIKAISERDPNSLITGEELIICVKTGETVDYWEKCNGAECFVSFKKGDDREIVYVNCEFRVPVED